MSFSYFKHMQHTAACYDVKDQLKQNVYRRFLQALENGAQQKRALAQPGQLEAYRSALRAQMLAALHLAPQPPAAPAATVTHCTRTPQFTVENLVLTLEDGTQVPGNLYLPAARQAPTGAVLFLSGHFPQARLHPEYQNVCQRLVLEGLAVLAIDPIGQGERCNYVHPETGARTIPACCEEHDYCGVQTLLTGQPLAAFFVRDARAALSYLASRPEVDAARLGVTGNSGGGMQTALMMLLDDRLAAAAPATFLTSRAEILRSGQPQDSEQILPGSALLGLDHDDFLLMMAPKPCLVLQAQYDFFPPQGTADTLDKARRLYALYGKAHSLEQFTDACGHRYSDAMAKQAADFFCRHLQGTTAAFAHTPQPFEEQTLCACTGFAKGPGVYEAACLRLQMLQQSTLPDAQRRAQATAFVRGLVCGPRTPAEPWLTLMPEWGGGAHEEMEHTLAMWWSQPDMKSIGVLVRSAQYSGQTLPVTIAVWQNGTADLQRHTAFLRKKTSQGRAVLVLDVSGQGALQPNAINAGDVFAPFGTLYTLCHAMFCMNDCLPALRAWEILAAVALLHTHWPQVCGQGLELYAQHPLEGAAYLAALLEPRICRVECPDVQPFAQLVQQKYYDTADVLSRVVPGMLQYCDVPDLARWTSANAHPAAPGKENI